MATDLKTAAAPSGETPYDPARDYDQPPEVIVSPTRRVACDGGGGALGHPLVYYDMGEADCVECAYCDRRFVLKGSPLDPTAER